jgi:hypothetical protein
MTQLRFVEHETRPGQAAVEVWIDGKFAATVTAADLGGVRIVTRHPFETYHMTDGVINVVEVRINA